MKNLKDVFISAKEKCTLCNVCVECNGVVCKGKIPGPGGNGSGSSFIRNSLKLKDVKVVMNLINDFSEVDTSTTLFNHNVDLPVYAAPIAGIKNNFGVEISDKDYNSMMLKGCDMANTIGFTGDGISIDMFTLPVDEIDNLKGHGICTIKPWVTQGTKPRIDYMNNKNVLALATDIDSAGLAHLRNSDIKVEIKSVQALKELKDSIQVPLIVKGIMSVKAAMCALQAGADAIVVSNHGGRCLDESLSAIEVLHDIAIAVDGRMTILVDGGFRTGGDVFKALALGANGVLIGRPITISAIGDGANGVQLYLNKIKDELADTMMMCGCNCINDINYDCIKVIN